MTLKYTFPMAGLALLVASSAFADERGTKEEALAMVDRAAAHFAAVGPQKAFADFSTKGTEWQDRDLYLFCFDKDGMTKAHGANEKLIDKNLTELKDADGNLFISALVKAGYAGGGWVDYRWANPMSKKIEAKSSFAKPFGDYVCGVGIYK